jgi:hypothetical protein
MEVLASELFTNGHSINEWGYDPGMEIPTSRETVDAPNAEINTSGGSNVMDFNGNEIKPGDTAQIRTDDDIFDVVFTGYNLDALQSEDESSSPNIAVYVPEGNAGRWAPGYYMVKGKDLNFIDPSQDFNPDEHAEELDDRMFRLNRLKNPNEFIQISKEENLSISAYQSFSYAAINKFLAQTKGMDLSDVKKLENIKDSPVRSDKLSKIGEPIELTDDVMSLMSTLVSNIDSVIERSPTFSEGTTLYRGLDASRKNVPIEGILDGSIIEFSSPTYASTSTRIDVAEEFATGESPVLFEITPSADLTGFRYQRDSGNIFVEDEILLGRDVVYKVLGIEYVETFTSDYDENGNQISISVPTVKVEARPGGNESEAVEAPKPKSRFEPPTDPAEIEAMRVDAEKRAARMKELELEREARLKEEAEAEAKKADESYRMAQDALLKKDNAKKKKGIEPGFKNWNNQIGKIFAVVDKKGEFGPRGDVMQATFIEKSGFNGKPQVLSQAEFDALEGETIYRGVTFEGMVTDYIESEVQYAGQGSFGNGTYNSNLKETAETYASGSGPDAGDLQARVMEMKLLPDANVLLFEEVPELREWASQKTTEFLEGYKKSGANPAEYQEAEWKLFNEGDWTNIAIMLGIDAVRFKVPLTDKEEYYTITLNRGKVAINGKS